MSKNFKSIIESPRSVSSIVNELNNVSDADLHGKTILAMEQVLGNHLEKAQVEQLVGMAKNMSVDQMVSTIDSAMKDEMSIDNADRAEIMGELKKQIAGIEKDLVGDE